LRFFACAQDLRRLFGLLIMTRLSEPALRVDVISKGTSSAGEAKQSPGLSPLNTRAEIDNLRDGPAKDPVLETNRASTKACPSIGPPSLHSNVITTVIKAIPIILFIGQRMQVNHTRVKTVHEPSLKVNRRNVACYACT
jgi:hypothetical protein